MCSGSSSLGLGEHRLGLSNLGLGGGRLLRGRQLVLELGHRVGDALLQGPKDGLCLLDGGFLTRGAVSRLGRL